MMRATPDVPLVIFPVDGEVRRAAPCATGAPGPLLDALAAVSRLREVLQVATGRGGQLDAALQAAVAAARRVAGSPAITLPEAEALGAIPRSPVHYYFGVRVASLSPWQHAAQAAAVIFRSLADLRSALVDVNDLVAEVEAVAAVLGRLWPQGDRPAGATWSEPTGGYEPDGDGLERWIVAHHLYFLLNLYAADSVRQATRAIADGAEDAAAGLLTEAGTYVRGFTAAMAHSAAIPASYYGEVVRPTMMPPAATMPLTGGLQPEHASYRAAVRHLLEASPEPFLVLTRRHRDLALARDALLEADLIDIERHVLVAEALVGSARSLVQHEQAPDNAVRILRQMRHERAAMYCPLMRFGDQVGGWAVTDGRDLAAR